MTKSTWLRQGEAGLLTHIALRATSCTAHSSQQPAKSQQPAAKKQHDGHDTHSTRFYAFLFLSPFCLLFSSLSSLFIPSALTPFPFSFPISILHFCSFFTPVLLCFASVLLFVLVCLPLVWLDASVHSSNTHTPTHILILAFCRRFFIWNNIKGLCFLHLNPIASISIPANSYPLLSFPPLLLSVHLTIFQSLTF